MTSKFPISRRHLIGGLAAIPFLPTPSFASTAVQRLMVQGCPSNTQSRYTVANIMPALDTLGGVRKMRCREPFSGTAGWSAYVGLAKAGVKFCFTLTAKRPIATSIADLKKFLTTVPGSFFAVEYPNEPDLNPVTYNGVTDPRMGFRTGNAPALMAFIKDFRRAFRADPAFNAVALVASNDFMQVEQAPYCNYPNTHIYPWPNNNIQDRLTGFNNKIIAANKTMGIITEWGRTTGGSTSNLTSPPVSLDEQARLFSTDVAAALSKPYVHTISIYELFCWTGTSEISNFGLFNADLTPRPAVAAIRSVLGV